MRLSTHKERMGRQFEYLHNRMIGGFPGEYQARVFELFDVLRIDLIAMPEPHSDGIFFTEKLPRHGLWFYFNVPSAEPHIPSEALDFFLLGQYVDYGLGAVGFDLGAVCFFQAADISGEFQNGHLKTEA